VNLNTTGLNFSEDLLLYDNVQNNALISSLVNTSFISPKLPPDESSPGLEVFPNRAHYRYRPGYVVYETRQF